MDRICIKRKESEASLSMPDGSTVDVPLNVLRRSTILQEAIADIQIDNDAFITAPNGLLQSWLQCIEILPSGKAAVQDSENADKALETPFADYLKVGNASVTCGCPCST